MTGTELATRRGPGTQQDLEVNVGDRVYFDLRQLLARRQAPATLERQAAWLQQSRRRRTIEGHCDERGTREYNLALGRAPRSTR